MAIFSGKKKYGKYDKFGIGPHGQVDPKRRLVSSIIGMAGGNRKSADWLYTALKGGLSGGGNKEDKDDGKDKGKKTEVYDVDFSMKGEMRPPPAKPPTKGERVEDLIGDTRDPSRFKMGRDVIPKLSTGKTMKQGGLVRGTGCAQRGRGKGKMV